MSEEDEKDVGGADVADICTRLIARGDELSLEATKYINGAYIAYCDMAETCVELRGMIGELAHHYEAVNALWLRVPIGVREVAATMPLQKSEQSQEKPHDPPLHKRHGVRS